MTTTEPAKLADAPATVPNTAQAGAKLTSAAKASGDAETRTVTLDELAREMKIPPRDARMLLRLAAKQKRTYPNLGKDHTPRQPWSWAMGSKALEEARKALASSQA